ncbi:hypothetical protein BP5796_01142 [Coleophoma crateriformis]|uniref:Uncharacterized protein n=1 Tax=Coleophoma crateriformis TaxID=565419 RepID=A0A3D8T167_9HELO|nr:hypothetical protein BP5796_01142 [Coleophoma crateriformis]
MQAGLRDVLGEDGIAEMAEYNFQQQQQAEREKQKDAAAGGTEDEAPPVIIPNWLKQWQKRYEGQEWGFVAIKSACYDDEERWEKFKQVFQEIIQIPFDRVEATIAAAAKAREILQIRWIEDPELDGASIQVPQERYESLQPTLPAGQSHPVFLSASSDAIESVLSASPVPSIDSKYWRPPAPYILAVAASSDPGLDEGHKEREWFRDLFKVAVEVLVEEFWFVVDSDLMPLRRVMRGVKGVNEDEEGDAGLEEMWWSTSPSPGRMRKRTRME